MAKLVILVLGFVLVVAACGAGDVGDGGRVLTISEALTRADGSTVTVQGALVVEGGTARVCEALAESYPPQCGGPALVLPDLDTTSVIGLTRPVPADLADVAWTDYPLTVRGTISGTSLTSATVVQPSAQASGEGLTARLTYWPDPLRAGGGVVWVMDVTNDGDSPVVLTFGSGQRGDLTLSQDGVEVYRWSTDKFFTQAIEQRTLEPGETLGFPLNDDLTVPAGTYELRAWTTANPAPPAVTTTVVVEP